MFSEQTGARIVDALGLRTTLSHGLDELYLRSALMTDRDLKGLRENLALDHLIRLDLTRNELTVDAVRKLKAAPQFRTTTIVTDRVTL